MEEILTQLQNLSPDELRAKIAQAGLQCGPITATTRSIFERKLAKTLLGNQAGDCSRSEVDGEETEVKGSSPKASSEVVNPSAQISEDESEPASAVSPSVFYGVLPPLDDQSSDDGSAHVYTSKQKALEAVKKMKGSRFKAFPSREEAEQFAKGLNDGAVSPSKLSTDKLLANSPEKSANLETVNMEKPNEFRSPRTQDLTAKLRKAVERGDEDGFKDLVWGNPRYLIGSGDNPTIVQEGCRYNALHVAAKENQPAMAQLILETLQNAEFMRLMYPDDREDMLMRRIEYVVDLYLNTPDKGSNETPLHFACKFGCTEVVNVLCSHPSIDKHCKNKYGQTPSSVICERKNKNRETKEKIQEYLEDRFFVPLLRATDNTLNPVIGVPLATGASKCDVLSELVEDPKNPLMTIRAFVGPLNSSKAKEFQKLWKTPPRGRARYFHDILKSDPDRGAERVGRELANEMAYPWAEYWDFLNCFTDLSEEDGLRRLEEYLRKAVQEEQEKSWIEAQGLASVTECMKGTRSGTLLDDDPNGSLNAGVPGTSGEKSPVCNLMRKFEKTSLHQASRDSGLGGLTLSTSDDDDDDDDDDGVSALGSSPSRGDDSGSDEYYSADEDVDVPGQAEGGENRSSSVSSGSSYRSTNSTPEDDEAFWENVFLAGGSPTKLDHEVLLAMGKMDVDEQRYPWVARWKNVVLSYPDSQRSRWPNVTPMNRTSERQTSTPRRPTHSRLTGSPSFLCGKNFSSPTQRCKPRELC